MNKEQVILNVKELQDKMADIDERLFAPDERVSALDLDTQLMYLRLLYDSYLSLRPEGAAEGRRKNRNRKEAAPKAEEKEAEVVEEVETSLPLMFVEEESADSPAEKKPGKAKKASRTEEAAPQAQVPAPAEKEAPAQKEPETKEAEVKEAETKKKETEVEVKEPEAKEAETQVEATEPAAPVTEEAPATEAPAEAEVDLSVLEDELPGGQDIDLDAIEFDDESDLDDADDEPAYAKREEEGSYEPYYPGLNPKAMDGELETGYPRYSEKRTQTLGEHFANQFPSLNDQLSQKKGEDRSIGSRKQKNQISDLTKSIDLNLKFTFVRELFNGNAKLLTEELNNLNQCGRLETALDLFEEMKEKYHWKEDNEACRQLYELVLRKYAR